MTEDDAAVVDIFYRYSFKGAEMVAIRAPFSRHHEKEMIGSTIYIDGKTYTVKAVGRQVSGHIQKGEPLGVEIISTDE